MSKRAPHAIRTLILCSGFAFTLAWLYACDGGSETPGPGTLSEQDAAAPSGSDATAASGFDATQKEREGGTVAPAACTAGAPAWAFVAETAPPASMTLYQLVTTTLTFRNCSGATVSAASNLKLGFSAPRDYDIFGISRIALPADVPNASEVTFTAVLRAPPLTGSHAVKWGLVDEGRAWLNVESPMHNISVQVAPTIATICPGVSADIGGGASASAALQACINQTPAGGTLEIPSGIYRVSSELHITSPITLRTAGTTATSVSCWHHDSSACAVLRADDNLVTTRGFFFVSASGGVNVDRIVLGHQQRRRL
jgi:hypothetical protein